MVWVKLDDAFGENPKIASLSDSAVALFVMGLAYCNRNLTDGFIPGPIGLGQLRYCDGNAVPAIRELEAAGIWEPAGGGWEVHDFAVYQPTRAQVEAEREAKSRAGRAGGLARAQARAKAPALAPAKARAKAPDLAESKPVPVPVPVPVKNGKGTESPVPGAPSSHSAPGGSATATPAPTLPANEPDQDKHPGAEPDGTFVPMSEIVAELGLPPPNPRRGRFLSPEDQAERKRKLKAQLAAASRDEP